MQARLQFEAPSLLARQARLRCRDDAHTAPVKLFDVGKRALDVKRGDAIQQILDNGSIHNSVVRLLSKTEPIDATVIFDDDEWAVHRSAACNSIP